MNVDKWFHCPCTISLPRTSGHHPPPPLPQRSPRIRRRHNYTSIASTNRSYDMHSSVSAPPPDTLTQEIIHFHHLCWVIVSECSKLSDSCSPKVKPHPMKTIHTVSIPQAGHMPGNNATLQGTMYLPLTTDDITHSWSLHG